MLDDFPLQAFAVLVILAAGMVVFYATVREPARYSYLERLAYCWPLGLTALAMPMFLMSLNGMRSSVLGITALVIAGGVVARLVRRVPLNTFWRAASATDVSRSPLTEFEWALLLIICACLGARTIACLVTPMVDWDGVCTWGIKAKILFFTPLKDAWRYFHNAEFRCTNQKYPLLWPMTYSWVCTVLGRWDDRAMCVVNPINMIAFVTVLYFALRRIVSRTVALAITAVATSLPASMHYTECVQSDIPLMLMNGAALCCLLAWIQDRRRESILLAGILLGGAMFTKQDGKIIFLAQICVAGTSILIGPARGERKTLLRHLGIAALLAVAYILPWLLYENTIPVWAAYYRPINMSTLRWRELPDFVHMVVENLLGFFNGVGLPKWNFLWPIMAVLLLTSRAPLRYPMNCVLLFFLMHLAGVSVVLLAFTIPFKLNSWEFALERFTLTMLPPLWLLFAKCVDDWWKVWKTPAAS